MTKSLYDLLWCAILDSVIIGPQPPRRSDAVTVGAAPDKFLTALAAAGYTIEQDWQPIETAPKDGTPVLVWWAHWCNHPIVASWYVGWSAEEAISSSGPDPTHWRPLPARPADAKDPP